MNGAGAVSVNLTKLVYWFIVSVNLTNLVY